MKQSLNSTFNNINIMVTQNHLTLKFYQNLGKLFYSIAAVDKEVRDTEIIQLKECVRKLWLNVDDLEDSFGTDAAYQIEIVFDWLHSDNKLNSKACYDDFINYKNDQNHLFTKTVKRLILQTANAIAESFSGKNKSELILLTKLTNDLNNE